MNSLTYYLEQYGLISLEKQEKLIRVVGEHEKELDYDEGLIRFNGIECTFQVLGTESDNTITWLWAWAEEQTETPDHLLRASLQMREWGRKTGLSEFTMPSVDLVKADGHVLSVISSAVCDASCYYHDPYEGGGLFILVFGKQIDQGPSFDIKSLSRQFAYLISLHDLNHRNALLSYIHGKGLPLNEEATMVTAELESGETLKAEFDKEGRLKTINGSELAA